MTKQELRKAKRLLACSLIGSKSMFFIGIFAIFFSISAMSMQSNK